MKKAFAKHQHLSHLWSALKPTGFFDSIAAWHFIFYSESKMDIAIV